MAEIHSQTVHGPGESRETSGTRPRMVRIKILRDGPKPGGAEGGDLVLTGALARTRPGVESGDSARGGEGGKVPVDLHQPAAHVG